jgi:hypothetical protein
VDGDLVAEVGGREVRFAKPIAYQRVQGVASPVTVDYELASAGTVRLRVGEYDSSAELIIDPVVSYATYLGGSALDLGNSIAVDSAGEAYVTGQTCSSDFPDSPNLSGLVFVTGSACDAFVSKYNATGTASIFTTILGGVNPANASASGNGIALDGANQVYIVGTSNIEDLPGTNVDVVSEYQGGDSDAFIAILATSTGALVRSTYLGGSGADAGYGIAVDAATPANVTVVGQTCSQDFPVYNAFETKVEDCVAFITKLDNYLDIASKRWAAGSAGHINPMASALTPAPASVWVGAQYEQFFFSETFGGQPVGPYPTAGAWAQYTFYPQGAIVLDTQNPPNIEVALNAGESGPYVQPTSTTMLPTPLWNAEVQGTTIDGSITWENLGVPAIPAAAFTEAYGIAIDPPGDVFVAGGTNTGALASTLWPCSNGSHGAWILKVFGNGGGCAYEWTVEGTATDLTATIDTARAVAVDSEGRAYLTGTASGTLGTTANAYKPANNGGTDAFLVRVNQLGSAIDYATYLGGSGNDQGLGVAVDGSFAPYVTGSTKSVDFPIINPLTNPNNGNPLPLSGTQGAFVSKFTADGSALAFSAYLGGSGADQGNAIAVVADVSSPNYYDMYVVGNTTSPDLTNTLLLQPMSGANYAPPQPTNAGNGDAFLAMIPGASIPSVTVAPGSLAFPNQNVGTTSPAQQILYSNLNSLSSVQIGTITFSSSQFQQTPGNGTPPDCNSGSVVQPEPSAFSKCQIMVTFTPSAQTLQNGTLTISDDASSTPHLINLSGEGAVPTDSFSASNLAFGSQAVSTTSVAQSVTLTNTSSTGTLFVSSISIGGTNVGDFSYSESESCQPQIAPVIAPSGTCTISVTFTPTALGPRSATVTVIDNAPGSPHLINLAGTGTPVASTVTPNVLTFPQQAINVPSAAQTVTVTNTDPTQTLVVSAIATTGDYQVTTNTCTGPIAHSGGSCVVQVVFDPILPGTRNGTLTVSGSGATMPATVTLNGTAGASATLLPATVTFPGTPVTTTSATQTVTLANQSPFTFNVQSVMISGAAASEFTQTNTCGTSVSASGNCAIILSFTPTATGNQNATLTVISDTAASPQSIPVVGVGTAPAVTLTPPTDSTVNFGNQPLSSASTAVPVTLTNSGTAPLNIRSITFAGIAAAEYSQTNTCGTQVAASTSCTINVIFDPTSLNPQGATLVISDNATPSTQTISLLGTGVAAGSGASGTIQLSCALCTLTSPINLPFPNQLVSTQSSAQVVTLSNSAALPLTVTGVALSGNTDFAISATTCATPPFTLVTSASCTISLTFTPSTTGSSESATLTVSGSSANSPAKVNITGTGSSVVTSGADFTMTPSATGVSVVQGDTAVFTITVAPVNGFNSSIAFTCAQSSPACSFSSSTLTMDGTTTKNIQLSVPTGGGSAKVTPLGIGSRSVFFALLPFSMMGMLLINKRRGFWLVFMLLGLCLVMGMAGCGTSGTTSSSSNGLQPGNTYEVTVVATSTGSTVVTHTMTLSVGVTAK